MRKLNKYGSVIVETDRTISTTQGFGDSVIDGEMDVQISGSVNHAGDVEDFTCEYEGKDITDSLNAKQTEQAEDQIRDEATEYLQDLKSAKIDAELDRYKDERNERMMKKGST